MSQEIVKTAVTLYKESGRETIDAESILTAYQDAADLHKAAKGLERIAVNECNGYQSEQRRALDERKRSRFERGAREIASRYGVAVTFGGDPRGYVVKLQTPKSGRYNSWGGASEGWGVAGDVA